MLCGLWMFAAKKVEVQDEHVVMILLVVSLACIA